MITALHVDARSSGSGQLPLLCVHGWGMNLRMFDLMRDALASERDTIAVDLPGHGRSPWHAEHADFNAQLDAVRTTLPPRCVLLGWSLGAHFAMELAVSEPDRIAALVLVSATPKFTQGQDWSHGMDVRSMQAFRSLLEQDWQQTLEDFVWLQLRGSRNAEAAQRVLVAALKAHGNPLPAALRNGLDLLETLDLRARASRILQPTLVVTGQNDRVTLPDAARWLAASLPRAQLVEIGRAAHAPFVSHQAEFSAALDVFLRAHASSAS